MKEINTNTKQNLLQITMQIIKKDGTDSVSMRTLGEKAGLSRSAVYRHFDSKEHLLAEIVTSLFIELNSSFKLEINKLTEYEKQIEKILLSFYDFGMKNHEYYKLMFNKDWDNKKYPHLTQAAYDTFITFASIITHAQQSNIIKKLPNNEMAAIIYSYIHGLIQLHQAGHSEDKKGLGSANNLIDSFYTLIKSPDRI